MFTVLYATAVLHLPQVFDLPYGELLSLSSLGLGCCTGWVRYRPAGSGTAGAKSA